MRRVLGILLVITVAGALGCAGDTADRDLIAEADRGPACEDIERFADSVVDVGITYDYSPTASPVDLARDVDVVFGGRLTGRVVPVRFGSDDGPSQEAVGYEVEVSRVVAAPELIAGDRLLVHVFVNGVHRDRSSYSDAVTPGIEVGVFAFDHLPLDGVAASLEGLMTSCPGGPLLGWTGWQGGWSGLRTVDDVLDSVDA